jgi:hypothetical protein
MLKNAPGFATAARDHFSSGSLRESSAGEHQILNRPPSAGVLQIDDLKDSFCD